MNDEEKTKAQFVSEPAEMRQRIAGLEMSETECRRAEKVLQGSQAELSAIFDNAPIAMILIDRERRVRKANRAVAEFADRPAEEMVGLCNGEALRCPHSLDDPRGCGFGPFCEACTMHRIVLDTLETDNCHHQVETKLSFVHRGTRQERNLRISTIPVSVSKGRMVLAYIEDVTARRQTEVALRQRNSELAFLNQTGQTLNSTLDLDQVLVTVLEKVRRLLGVVACSIWLTDLETDELVCQQSTGPQSEVVRGWRLAPGEGLAGWVAHSGRSLIVPDVQIDERHFAGVDQETGLGLRSILSVPLYTKNAVIGVLQVTDTEVDRFSPTDLTLLEPMAASAATAIDNARLVETLRQRNTELQARNEELDAFAHTVAHDLKGPLAPIVGYAETLMMDYATSIDQDGLRRLHKVAQNGRKMGRIIDELLLLAGVRKMGKAEMMPLDMASIVAEAQERLAQMIEEHQAEIILPDTWPVALGHAPWVEEVWVNYLDNAINYGGQPPRVELGGTPPSVPPASFDSAQDRREGAPPLIPPTSGGEVGGEMVCFWIRDNGPGLTPEEQARLFTPFTRFAPKGGRGRAKGHGLGLSIVRRIMEKLGGQVGVESKVGQGSVFSFTLPEVASQNNSQ